MFLLHGWMDVSASFQFLVDCFEREWYVIAPDWRGFGLTEWAHDGYWFPDYYADLDALLAIYEPDAPVNLVAHSMGGNVACTYAGIRPRRVARLVSMEGFGASRTAPEMAPARYEKLLDHLRDTPDFRSYPSFDAVAARLQKNNPRLSDEMARFLAQHWAKQTPAGEVVLRSDPRHRIVNPVLNRIDEVTACWRRITAPVLWVTGADSKASGWRTDDHRQLAERKGAFVDFSEITLPQCGHMMHHDQPRQLAAIIEDFLSRA
jgi:pimeloyl-ACP methyl ester carboxylesterase